MHYEDALLEMARVQREAQARVVARIRSQQLGEAFRDLNLNHDDRRQPERRAA